MDSIISFKGVKFSYPPTSEGAPPLEVLRGVSLDIHPGEMVAILGHNGSGKSTLAKLTNGILLPNEGTVLAAGMDTSDESKLLEIRQAVGLVFQNPDNQIVATVVEEDVAFALENLGIPSAEIRERVDEALNTVGMYDYREHAPHRLSGGQKQRVAIAGVIAMHPQVLVLDEPTAMLDPKGRAEVMRTVSELCSRGVTILMVTHHMNEAALCSRVIVMDKGEVKLDAPPAEVFRQYDTLSSFRLTVPQTVELARALGAEHEAPLTIDECAEAIYKQMVTFK